MGKRELLSVGEIGQLHAKESTILYHIKKTDSKWIQDFNLRPEIIKILEGNTGHILFDIGLSNTFWMSPQARETKAKINKWDLIKLKSFGTAKETINKTKKQNIEWNKVFANDVSNKGLIHKKLIHLNIKKKKERKKKNGQRH